MAGSERGGSEIGEDKLSLVERIRDIRERAKERALQIEKQGRNTDQSNQVDNNLGILIQFIEENKLPPEVAEKISGLLEEYEKIQEQIKQSLAKEQAIERELEERGFRFLKFHDPVKVDWRNRHERNREEIYEHDRLLERAEGMLAEIAKEFTSLKKK